jgi:hypothetical protein
MQKAAGQIPFAANSDVLSAIDRIGRTEDLHFSPDNSRLAIAGFNQDRILVLEIDIRCHLENGSITVIDFLEVTSNAFSRPHGLYWIDNQTIIVANRNGEVPIFRIPTDKPRSKAAEITPTQTIRTNNIDLLQTPGSVSVSKIGFDLYEVLICNNYGHYVTRHIVDKRDNFAVKASSKLLSEGLHIPDGVSHSHCGRWIAVSNHTGRNVFLYENNSRLTPSTRPYGTLQGLKCPHGVRFTSNDRYVLVADAAAPFVHIYAREAEDWAGQYYPAASIRVMDDYAFYRGHRDPEVGGPKGIDLSQDNKVLVASCEEQPLVFIDLSCTLKNLDQRFLESPRQFQDIDQAERLRLGLLGQLQGLNAKYEDALTELEETRKSLNHLQKLLGIHHYKKLTSTLTRLGSMNGMKAVIRKVLPEKAEILLRRQYQWAEARLRRQYRRSTLHRRRVFTDIYRSGIWRQSGQPPANLHDAAITQLYVKTVTEFLTSLGKPNVVDLGCGDFAIGSRLRPYCDRYIACDIVPELIAHNRQNFADVDFTVLDIVRDELPKGDVAIIRHVLQHLSNAEIANVVARMRYPFLIVTEHLPDGDFEPNKDQKTGVSIRLGSKSGVVLTEPPFSFKPTYQRILCEASEGGGIIRTILYHLNMR